MTTAPPAPAPAPTAAPPAPAEDPTGTAVPRRRIRHARWYLLAAAFVAVVGLVIGGLGGNSTWPPLDPRSPDPDGARALVNVLQREGVTVSTAAGPDELAAALRERNTTVVVPDAYLLDRDTLDRLGSPRGRLVLITPDDEQLDAFARGVRTATAPDGLPDYAPEESTGPACTLPEARLAGTAELGGTVYVPAPADTACYPRHGGPTLVLHEDGSGGQTVVLGTARPLTNDRLDDDGNASLAMSLLGSRPHLVWYLPDYASTEISAPAGEGRGLMDLLPRGWHWATLQLALATVLAAVWRARRLGPVISEKLPVVVRASETTEGRARLYRRANARGHAADALRRAARHRLAPVLGVPADGDGPDPAALAAAAAGRIGRPSADVHALLHGTPPTDDAALLRLADDLDALERQVRQP